MTTRLLLLCLLVSATARAEGALPKGCRVLQVAGKGPTLYGCDGDIHDGDNQTLHQNLWVSADLKAIEQNRSAAIAWARGSEDVCSKPLDNDPAPRLSGALFVQTQLIEHEGSSHGTMFCYGLSALDEPKLATRVAACRAADPTCDDDVQDRCMGTCSGPKCGAFAWPDLVAACKQSQDELMREASKPQVRVRCTLGPLEHGKPVVSTCQIAAAPKSVKVCAAHDPCAFDAACDDAAARLP